MFPINIVTLWSNLCKQSYRGSWTPGPRRPDFTSLPVCDNLSSTLATPGTSSSLTIIENI